MLRRRLDVLHHRIALYRNTSNRIRKGRFMHEAFPSFIGRMLRDPHSLTPLVLAMGFISASLRYALKAALLADGGFPRSHTSRERFRMLHAGNYQPVRGTAHKAACPACEVHGCGAYWFIHHYCRALDREPGIPASRPIRHVRPVPERDGGIDVRGSVSARVRCRCIGHAQGHLAWHSPHRPCVDQDALLA